MSTLDWQYQTTIIAGTTYIVKMQSNNMAGVAIDVSTDTYIVSFSDGTTTDVTATHQSSGLYEASFTPTVAGTFELAVHMTNAYTATDLTIETEINGSDFPLIVLPG